MFVSVSSILPSRSKNILKKERMTIITIVNVDVATAAGKNGKNYETAEVVYKKDGQTQTKKLVSFNNPAVFAGVKAAKKGETYSITQEKDKNDYWQWTSFKPASNDEAPAQAAQSSSPRPAQTNTFQRDFESKDERETKQRYIIRQSSLSNAVSILTTGAKAPPNINDVKKLADELVAYVYEAPSLFEMKNDLPAGDDIPF